MHAKRFSSVKQSTQGLAGDALLFFFCPDAFEEDGSMFVSSFIVIVDVRAIVSAALDSIDDVIISTSLPSDELADDAPAKACSYNIQTYIIRKKLPASLLSRIFVIATLGIVIFSFFPSMYSICF